MHKETVSRFLFKSQILDYLKQIKKIFVERSTVEMCIIKI